jgi:hypothetical protein
MPTPAETIEHIIRHQSHREGIPFLLQLEKKDVVAVRAKVKSLHKELDDYGLRANGQWARLMQPHQEVMLFLAGLVTYSRKEALARGFGLPAQFTHAPDEELHEHRQLLLTVLEHTRPDWLGDWFEQNARANKWDAPNYQLLRELETRQLLPFHPWLFARALAHWLVLQSWRINTRQGAPHQTITQLLLTDLQSDETLLQRDVPLLFDFDTLVDSAAIYSQNQQEKPDWLQLLLRLVESGHLDRADLLTRSLLALRRDFRRPLLTWFKNLFVSLKPTAAERLARQSELVELLAHPLPLVVNFALEQLKDLWTNTDFSIEALLLYADGLMTRQDLKTGLTILLGGFGKLLKTNPTQAPALTRLYASALAHADASIQERAAKGLADILNAKKPLLSSAEVVETTDAIGWYADLLPATARTILGPWLGANPVAGPSAAGSYAPISGFVPEISAATAIAPVADWHELLFLTGQVLRHDDPAALERWLDGLLRLQPHFPANYSEPLQPYVLQILPYIKGRSESERAAIMQRPAVWDGHLGLVQALVLSWATGFATPLVVGVNIRGNHAFADPLVTVEQQRLAFVEAQLQAQRALPLLSTPTHAPHWVAPTALVNKLLAYEAAQQEPNMTDLVVALARTAHAHAAEAGAALTLLPQLRHEGLRELLHWLLKPIGEPVPVAEAGRKSVLKHFTERLERRPPTAATLAEALPWLWAVAARTKAPTAEFPALTNLTAGDCPGVVRPWQPRWELPRKSNTYVEKWKPGKPEVTDRWTEFQLIAEPAGVVPNGRLLYSLHAAIKPELLANRWQYLTAMTTDYPFLLALLPQHPAPLYWHTLRLTATRDVVDSATRDVLSAALRSLLVPRPALDEPTTLLLAVGITHNAAGCRALAREVLLATVEQRRLEPAALGRMLGQLLATEYAPVQRLAEELVQARAISPATDDALCQALEALLPELSTEPPRNTRKLIEAYADLVGRTSRAVPTPVQDRLREWRPTASLKKAASALLV